MNIDDAIGFELPPFQRKPPRDSAEWATMCVQGGQAKRAKLLGLGLQTSKSFDENLAYWEAELRHRLAIMASAGR